MGEGGDGGGGEGCSLLTERVVELENDKAERESRGEDSTYTPFLFGLLPLSKKRKGGRRRKEEEEEEDSRRVSGWDFHTVTPGGSEGDRNMPLWRGGPAAGGCQAAASV